MLSSLKFNICWYFFTLGIAGAHVSDGLRRRGGNISVDLSLFALLYNTNVKNKLKFNDQNNYLQNNSLTAKTIFNLQNHPFLLRGKVGQPFKRKRVLCWSIYIISWCSLTTVWAGPSIAQALFIAPLVMKLTTLRNKTVLKKLGFRLGHSGNMWAPYYWE